MRRIEPLLTVPAAAEIVEVVDANRIAREGLWCDHILDPEIRPETARAPEGAKPAFGRQPGAVSMTMLLYPFILLTSSPGLTRRSRAACSGDRYRWMPGSA